MMADGDEFGVRPVVGPSSQASEVDGSVKRRLVSPDFVTPDASNRGTPTTPRADWLAAMIRNYIDQDDALKEAGSIVIQSPGDPQTVYVLQRGGDHLMVQVNHAELVIR